MRTQEQTVKTKFCAGAKWQTMIGGKPTVKIVQKEWDKFNVRLTSGQIFSKRMLNKYYTFIGMADLAENKKKPVDKRKFMYNDGWIYETLCQCGLRISGWSEREADENWDIHFC